MAGTIQNLFFENPGKVNATLATNISWSPNTFNAKNHGNFSFNLWLLRKDSKTNAKIKSYPPALLAQEHNVFDIGILWTPSMDNVDTNVPQTGSHQMAWERSDDNPSAATGNTAFKGFSQAFHVLSPDDQGGISSSSVTPTAPTSIPTGATDTQNIAGTPSPDSSPQSTSLPSGTPSATISKSAVIGLGAGLGLLVMAVVIGAVFWMLHRRRRRKGKEESLPLPVEFPSEMRYPQYIYIEAPKSEPAELDTAMRTVERDATRRTMEPGMGTDAYPGYR